MYAGEVVEQGTTQAVFHHPKHPYTQKLLACDPAGIHEKTRELPTIPGEIPDLVSLPEGCIFKNRCEQAVPECEVARPAWTDTGQKHFVSCHLEAKP